MGAFDAAALLLYFVAIRETGVAIATFFLFIQPVWVALLAPRLLGSATERFVYVAIGLALGGLAVILGPGGSSETACTSPSSVSWPASSAASATPASPWSSKGALAGAWRASPWSSRECALDALFLLPLALWQTLGAGYSAHGRDLLVALVLGLVCHGGRVHACGWRACAGCRVQHSAVLGFLTPVAAPIYALVLLGQTITGWTAAGGALILAAGILVVLRGQSGPRVGAAGVSAGRRGKVAAPRAGAGPPRSRRLRAGRRRRTSSFGLSASLVDVGRRAGERPPRACASHSRSSSWSLVFARRQPLAGAAGAGRLAAASCSWAPLDAVTVLAYFFAVRAIGVAIATFFLFMQPVWVALARAALPRHCDARASSTSRWRSPSPAWP